MEQYSKADAFNKLSAAATKVAQQQAEMPAGDVASMYIALLGFTGKVYPDKLDFTDKVLTECYQVSEQGNWVRGVPPCKWGFSGVLIQGLCLIVLGVTSAFCLCETPDQRKL